MRAINEFPLYFKLLSLITPERAPLGRQFFRHRCKSFDSSWPLAFPRSAYFALRLVLLSLEENPGVVSAPAERLAREKRVFSPSPGLAGRIFSGHWRTRVRFSIASTSGGSSGSSTVL
jgi:hypothetical protein